MTQNDIFSALSEALSPCIITRIVELPDCYVLSVCNYDGEILMQPPYSVTKDGSKVSFYNVRSKESISKLKDGKVIYDDPTFRKISSSSRKDGGPGSGNFGHAGVPGKVGGSAPSSLNAAVSEKVKSSIKQMTDDDSEGFLEDWLDIHGSERRAIVKSGNIQSEIDKRLAAIDSKRQEFSSSVCDTSAQRKKIDEIAPTLADEKIENNYSISETGEILEHVTGSAEGADITNFDVPYATIHNHPGIDVTFSTTDIETFAKNDKMTSMTVQAKGTVYSIEKTDQKAEKNIADMYSDYYGIYSSNRSSEENFYKMRVWLYLNAHKYGVLYSEHENSRNDGGPGSGNHGHKGVPGQVGGSAPSTSGPISKSSFQNGSGHFEVTGDVKDMYLTKPARTRIEGAIKTVKTANDLKKYLENQGIKLETSYEPLKKAMDREIPAIKEQADYVIAAIEQYKDLGGLKALKAVHLYEHDIDAQAQYSYRAKGEEDVPDEGHLYISYMADGAQIMHEFAHAYADSTKPDGMDVVEWSAKLNQEAGLSKDVKAYFGANSDAKEAERFANAMGYAIADGDGPDGRLAFAANVANIVKNSNGKSAGTSSENLAYKSLVPKNSYTKTSAEYKNALDAYRAAIRKGDEAKDKYMAAEKAMKAESKPKPESEWDDNDIFEDLLGHRPMIYTEKGKQLKAEYDKYFKESMDYGHEITVAGDKLREIKQKEHDKQSKDIHLEHTKDATSNDYEGFTTKTTGTSYYDDYLNGEKNGGRIAEMSPKEYLQRCAYQIFDSATIESTIAALDDKNVKKYAEQMKSGTKFDMPYLNFASGQQEGRHRAAAAMQLGIDKIPVLVVGERFAKYDGGPGSGNFNHEGRPGEVGGSAPKGSADSTASVQKLSKLKDGFSNLTNRQQFAFLKKTGSISVSDLYALETKINSGDNSAAEDLKKYSKSYFDNVESSKAVKSLVCDTRDKVSAMTPDDARAWIDKSVHRNFNESEMWWVNWGSIAQKVAIDLGMNETPQVVSKEDFNKYVEESGAAVCYRGVRYAGSMSGSNMIYQMAYDKQKNYFGNGIYGDGLYFSTDRSAADSYSDGSGAVAKCAIRPDAKVVEFRSAEIEGARRKYGTSDYAIAAMCAGYDAIKVHVSSSEDYYVVLNRAAMVMEDPVDSLANMAIEASERNAAKKSSS